jgi:hypothetical protein
MRKLLISAAALALLMTATAAQATTYLAGGGWQEGVDNAINTAQAGAITLDVTNPAGDTFSLTDGFLVGDVYKVAFKTGPVTITNTSTFTSYPTSFNNNLGDAADFAAPWLNDDYSHLQVSLSPGIYTVTVKELENISFPAHFGFRLDAVPEPATWAMMMLGVGLIGVGLRMSRKSQSALTAA